MKKPRWDCRNGADRKALEVWTNARLDELDEPSDDDIAIYIATMTDEKFHDATVKHFGATIRRNRAINKFKAMGWKPPHGVGRAKGEPRPGDLSDIEKAALEYAADDVESIYRIWRQDFQKRNRGAAPTAIAIAARRAGIDEEQLINFRKNRHRQRK
jgi:hypothetical protein